MTAAPTPLPSTPPGTLLPWSRRLRAAAGNRLVQFMVIGGAMFGLAPAAERREVVSIDSQALAALIDADTAVTTPGGPARRRDIERRVIEDEVLYREGVRLGFDRDDGIVKQRVVQKVLFLAEELGGGSRPPTLDELRAFHRDNAERFALPSRVHFRQVFAHEAQLLPAAPEAVWPLGGQVSPVGPEMEATESSVADALGAEFVATLQKLPVGAWSATVPSAYGWHRVKVIARTPARPSEFDEVESDVREQFTVARRQEAIARYLSNAFARYRLEMDGRPAAMPSPSRRLAMRSAPSAED